MAMGVSLFTSSRRLRVARLEQPDVDDQANRIMFLTYAALIVLALANAFIWRSFGPVLTGLVMNLLGTCAQFGRLIRSAFRESAGSGR